MTANREWVMVPRDKLVAMLKAPIANRVAYANSLAAAPTGPAGEGEETEQSIKADCYDMIAEAVEASGNHPMSIVDFIRAMLAAAPQADASEHVASLRDLLTIYGTVAESHEGEPQSEAAARWCRAINAAILALQNAAPQEPGVGVIAWIHEDELPKGYPYDAMFPFSKVDGVRMFPVYAPQERDADLDSLLTFYGVTTLSDLAREQARHVERLQAKLPPTPNPEIQGVRDDRQS